MKRAILTTSMVAALIIVASCTKPVFVRPPALEPRGEHRVFLPDLHLRGLAKGVGCSLGDIGGPWDNVHKFPRIIATDGDYQGSDLEPLTSNLCLLR